MLNLHFKVNEVTEAVTAINNDLQNIYTWAISFGLLVNLAKSQAIIVGGKYMYNSLDMISLTPVSYNNTIIPTLTQVKI